MRLSLVIIASVASLASASALSARQTAGYPSCSLPCIEAGANKASTYKDGSGKTCSATDATCLCSSPQFVSDTTKCVTAACTNPSDLQQAESTSIATCKAAGVNLTASASSTAAGGSTAAGSATAGSASTTSAAPAATTTAKSAGFVSKSPVGITAVGIVAAVVAMAL